MTTALSPQPEDPGASAAAALPSAAAPEGSAAAPVLLPDLATTPVDALARALVDVPSVSGQEAALADAVERALGAFEHLQVFRDGDTVLARTTLGRAQRVIIAGHLDTVHIKDNVPARLVQREVDGAPTQVLWGRGSVDMKGGVAVALQLAATLTDPRCDVTYVFYDNEEVEASRNGLGRIAREQPEWLQADFAILAEPTNAQVEGGCNGTLRVAARTSGVAAHSARAWRGHNAVHDLAPVLLALALHEPQTVRVDGLDYRESLSAVGVHGGIAGNVIPDEAAVTINYRFAPSRSVAEAEEYVARVLADARSAVPSLTLTTVDAAAGARPGLTDPLAQEFVAAAQAATGAQVNPKYGWTDVARFSELGIPAVNFGPGDPMLAHADDEFCPTAQIQDVATALAAWLTGPA